MKITIIAGARPNFIKIAPIIHAIQGFNRSRREVNSSQKKTENKYSDLVKGKASDNTIAFRLVHTGQHYDDKMSNTFFKELNIPEPDINLNCGGGTQAEQTSAIMISFEKDLLNNPTDLVLVVGDVTSTMACTIAAKKLNTKVAHVEAGIRSYDITMPEEINRMVTDCLADYFFTTTIWAGNNLNRAGISNDRIFFVGNVMIDTLLKNKQLFRKPTIWDNIGL